jgi:hypothetical protein
MYLFRMTTTVIIFLNSLTRLVFAMQARLQSIAERLEIKF